MKCFLVLSLTLSFINLSYAQQGEAPPAFTPAEIPVEDELFKITEEMPRFPGCDDVLDVDEKYECSDKKLNDFIINHIEYPEAAIINRTEGTVYFQFIVNKDGALSDFTLLRGIGDGWVPAVRNVLKLMNENHKWIPGKSKGKPVRVLYTLPVDLKLPD